MFSDSALTATSVGLVALVALRWKTLPEDIRTVQIVVNYLCHLAYLKLKNRGSFSQNVDLQERYPRPPRTVALPPTPPRNYVRPEQTTAADADDVSENSGEEAAEAKEDLEEDKGEDKSTDEEDSEEGEEEEEEEDEEEKEEREDDKEN